MNPLKLLRNRWRSAPALPVATRPESQDYPRPGPSSACAELFTLVGRDLSIGCGIDSAGPVVVSGSVAGNIEAPWAELDAGSLVRGTIRCESAVIKGEVDGSLYGRNIALGPNVRISGEVVCERLYAAPGAAVKGRTHPSMKLDAAMLAALSHIARCARAGVKPDLLDALKREGLVFEYKGAFFVSLFGHLELGRRWTRSIGHPTRLTSRLHIRARRPSSIALYRGESRRLPVPLSVIADDVRLDSDLATAGDIRIHGDVRGDVRARACAIGDAARVEGNVNALCATVAGSVRGAVNASNLLLLTTARIAGPMTFGALDARGGALYDVGRQMKPGVASAGVPAQAVAALLEEAA